MADTIWLRQANDTVTKIGGVADAAKTFTTSTLAREDIDTGLGVYRAGTEYDTIAAGVTRLLMGTSILGDYLESLICVVTTATTAQVQIKDGADAAITVLPATVAATGTYIIPLGLFSRTGGWQVIAGAGVSVIATGVFS